MRYRVRLHDLVTLAGVVIGAVFVVLAALDVDFGLLARALSGANWWFLGAAVISVLATNVAKTMRWRTLFGTHPSRPSLMTLGCGILLGQFANIVLPARMGEVARIVLINRTGGSAAFALGTLVTEKLAEAFCALLLLLIAGLVVPLPEWARVSGVTIAATVTGLLMLQVVLTFKRDRLLELAERWIERAAARRGLPLATALVVRLQSGIDGLTDFARAGGLLSLVLWSVLVWTTAVLTNEFVFRALRMDVPLVASIWMLVVLQAGIALPASLGRIGAFLYLSQLGLALFAVEPTPATGFGLVLFIVAYGPQILLGIVALRIAGLSIAGLTPGLRATPSPSEMERGTGGEAVLRGRGRRG